MKKLFLVLGIAFLLQSCFSYRHETDASAMVVGKKYKIERNHKTRKFFYTRATDSAIVVSKSRNGKEVQIPLKEITGIRKKKFSAVKTIALIPITAATAVLVFLLTDPGINMGEIQGPN
jgi:hypothetical protein